MNQKKVVIVSAVRSPIGRFCGTLSNFTNIDLGAIVIAEAVKRAKGVTANDINEVIMGCIMQTEPRGNPAREALLRAELPISIPAYTVNKNCASSIKSITLGAASIMLGENDMVVAGGMESMTNAPHLLRKARSGYRLGHSEVFDFLTDTLEGMGLTAERLAEQYAINRDEQDQFACSSQIKAAKAQQQHKFTEEIVPILIPQKRKDPILFTSDEGIRADSSVDKLAKLQPAFTRDGTVTAGNSSTLSDGAAAMVLMSEERAEQLNIKPLVRIVDWTSTGCAPEIMGIGPVAAVNKLCKRNALTIDDFDLIELNEAFAAQSIAVIKELGIDTTKCNVNGGAIAHGHPVGATGAILIIKLINELKRRKLKRGLVTLCVGGGQGMALYIENYQD
ncbi:MAG: thiolase family protein [Bacteroidetes bacterium]|nr:thiolase family protein [Bacteroidota bacterium]